MRRQWWPPEVRPARGASVNRLRRRLLGRVAVAAMVVLTCHSAGASRADKRELNIEAGSAIITLAEFVHQTGLQVLFEFDAVRDHNTRGVKGQFEAAEALGLMLEGSGLVFEFVNERTVTVRPRLGPARRAAAKTASPGESSGLRSL
jgi:Secretin and TonB N terminus short domain